jgi:threonine aldolase
MLANQMLAAVRAISLDDQICQQSAHLVVLECGGCRAIEQHLHRTQQRKRQVCHSQHLAPSRCVRAAVDSSAAVNETSIE